MVYDGTIRFNTKIDEAGFNKGVSSMTKGLGSIKSILTGIGIAWGVEKVAQVLFSVGKQSISLASDLQEVQNVVDVSFGSMKQKIEDFADTSIEKFGMSELSAKKTASTYMAIAKAMDINSDKASDMSINLTGLTGDMASFYNVTQDVADTALKSIFTGETETLKRFGIVMTQANLEAFAFKNGITKSYQAMTDAEKVQLRYYYVLNATKLAQGDFARTSDSWANQTRVLSENFKELLGILGGALMEILLPIVRILNEVIKRLIEVFKWIGNIYTTLTGKKIVASTGSATASTNELIDSTLGAADAQSEFADSVKNTGKEIKGQLANFDELNVLQRENSGGGGGFDNIDFGDSLNTIVDDTAKATENANGLKKELEDFFVMFENRGRTLRQELLIPITIPAPIVESLKSPLWDVKSGLEGIPTLVPAPEFESLKNPIYNPVWNIAESLMPELEKAKEELSSWVPEMEAQFGYLQNGMSAQARAMASEVKLNFADFQTETQTSTQRWRDEIVNRSGETAQNVDINVKTLKESVLSNFGEWQTSSKYGMEQWKAGTTGIMLRGSQNMLQNFNAFLDGSNLNIASWANQTGKDMAAWGNGMTKISHSAAYNIVSEIVGGLKEAWRKFREAMSALGEKVSGSFSGSFNIPSAGVIGAGVLGTIGTMLKLTRGGFVPALANGAVIPPNSEFLAILGDQKSGTNIETPLATMVDAFKTAIVEMGVGGGGESVIVLKLNETELGRATVKSIKNLQRQTGVSLITV